MSNFVILLVEPDRQLGDIYCRALSAKGLDVKVCHDATSAIASLDDYRPDLIVTELELPTHNGVELLYELRSYYDWQQLPVIVLTNQPFADNDRLQATWQRLKVSGRYYKPLLTLQKLVSVVDYHLALVTS